MEQTNYWKIIWILAFIAFAAVSCWATTSSFHLLLPTWPIAVCGIVTVGFFIIASLGTKMIVDSLNQNIYMEKRGLNLIGGIILTLIFWLLCSMPTNTHTFFYHTIIYDKTATDISTTRAYLEQISDNTNNKNQATVKVNELKNKVDVILAELEAEIKNEANPGFGPKSKEILRKLAALLGVAKIEPLSFNGTSKQAREKLCDAYREKVYLLADSKANHIKTHILSPNPNNIKEAQVANRNLALMKEYIDNGIIDLYNPKDVVGEDGVCDKLNESYNIIKKNRDFINFTSESDENNYTADNPISQVKHLISVFDVWKDYLKGKYDGYGFAFWIIISVLVDIAAFVFFDLAFRKTE